MSIDGSCELYWGGDKRRFRLGIAELLALQERRRPDGGGPNQIARRLYDGTWLVEDVQEVLRLGLIGAGVEFRAAEKLVELHVRPGRIKSSVLTAYTVLIEALNGDPDEPVGKAGAAAAPESSASPPSPSTATAP